MTTSQVRVFPNKGRRVDRYVQLIITIMYLASMWFGLFVIRFWPSLMGFSIVWLLLMLYMQYPPYQPIEIRFQETGFTARFRKGEKAVNYADIVRLEWGGDFAGKGVMMGLRNDDVVSMNGIDPGLLNEILDAVGRARTDLGLGSSRGIIGSTRGEVADNEHRNASLLLSWRSSYGVELVYWGYRPKGAKK